MKESKPSVSLIFLNYNGKQFLDLCLPTARQVRDNYGNCEIIVVDNGSSDNSQEHIQNNYPFVRLVALPKNVYFSAGCNAGARVATGDLLFFLNNDTILEANLLPPLVKHFEEPDIFAVTPRVLRPKQNMADEGIICGTFKGGIVNPDNMIAQRIHPRPQEPLEIFNACGAAMLVDRTKFFSLEGFDTLMRPFYIEETDLSYRAWKRGWKSIYEPRSMLQHLHNQTISKTFRHQYALVSYRKNQYLFVWKNISDIRYLLAHFFQMILIKVLVPNIWEWWALGWAVLSLPEALWKRRQNRGAVWSDRKIFMRQAPLAQYLYAKSVDRPM